MPEKFPGRMGMLGIDRAQCEHRINEINIIFTCTTTQHLN